MRKDYFWNGIGVFAQNLLSPLLIIVVTRINGIYDSGVLSFSIAAAVIFWAINLWGGRTYQVSDEVSARKSISYLVARVALAFGVVGMSVLFCLFNGYDFEKSLVLIILVVYKAIESIADSLHGIIQIHNKLHAVGLSLLIKASLSLLMFVLIDKITESLILSCLGIVFANLVVTIFYDYKLANKLQDIRLKGGYAKIYFKDAMCIIRKSSAIFVVLFLSMFSLNIPRYFIDIYKPEDIGYFGIMAMPITLLGLFISFIIQPQILKLSNDYKLKRIKDFRKDVLRIFFLTLSFGMATVLITALIGVKILNMVFGVDFDTYSKSLLIMVSGGVAGALVVILINVLTIMRKFKYQTIVLSTSVIAMIPLTSYVVSRYGTIGGVTVYSLTVLVQAIFLLIVYRKSLKPLDGSASLT